MKPVLGQQINWGHPLARGLVGCWPFNEGSGNKVFDLSGNGNTGNRYGTGVIWVTDRFGSAQQFNEIDDYLDFGSSQTIRPNLMSFSCWIKAGDQITDWGPVIGGNISDAYMYGFCIFLTSSEKINFYTRTGGDVRYWNSAVSLTIGELTNLVLTWDGTVKKAYKNGLLVGTNTPAVGGNLEWGTVSSIWTGRIVIGGSYFLNATISNLSLYNRALSSSEIALLYREPFCMFEWPNVSLLNAAAAPPPPTKGQVIFIQMSSLSIPVMVILGLTLIFGIHRKKCQMK